MRLETNQLTEQQKKEIYELVTICNKTDRLHGNAFLEQELNIYSDVPCFFLYYDSKNLVSFLSLFFSHVDEVEISAYTHPDYRRQGHFSNLLCCAFSLLKSFPIKRILFMAEPHCNHTIKTLSSLHAKYLYSDYSMTLFRNCPYILSEFDFSLSLAHEEDFKILSSIHAEAFGVEEDVSKDFLLDIFSQDSVLCYKFLFKNNTIGFCNVLQNASSVFLFGICIRKRVQNRGYGKIMMKFLLNDLLLLKKSITLQVNSLNIPALHLYQQLGFSPTICFDFYSIENKCF